MAEQRIIVRGHSLSLWETGPDGILRRVLRCYCGYGRNGFAFSAAGVSPCVGIASEDSLIPNGQPTPAAAGQGALPLKREGDGRTPVGVFPIELAFGLASNPGTALPWKDITPTSFWSSDSGTYNTWIELSPEVLQVSQKSGHQEQKRPILTQVSQKTGHQEQSGSSEGEKAGHLEQSWATEGEKAGSLQQSKVPDGERLADYPVQYKYAAVIGYNTEQPVFGAGSAIFLHCYGPRKPFLHRAKAFVSAFLRLKLIRFGISDADLQNRERRTATAGCISVPEKIMVRLLRILQPGAIIDIAPSAANKLINRDLNGSPFRQNQERTTP